MNIISLTFYEVPQFSNRSFLLSFKFQSSVGIAESKTAVETSWEEDKRSEGNLAGNLKISIFVKEFSIFFIQKDKWKLVIFKLATQGAAFNEGERLAQELQMIEAGIREKERDVRNWSPYGMSWIQPSNNLVQNHNLNRDYNADEVSKKNNESFFILRTI